MKPQAKSLQTLVEEQCKKWEIEGVKRGRDSRKPVITVSRQAGSMGRAVAKKISDETGMPVYGVSIIKRVAEDAGVRETVVRSLDEKSRSWLEEIIASWEGRDNIVADEFHRALVRVIGTIGRHGNAIILGRAGAFILPSSNNFRVRFIAPLSQRIGSFVREFKLSPEEAEKRIHTVDADRKEFVKTHFGADIDDPIHYDLVINGDSISPGEAVGIIRAALALNRKA
ncbi:MAG: cytidylate kinase-like family protein [Deltaproteobacteria bacterium]|nr:cytidylate kinase-like family protein [Deltaproteobacteria bacterium]